jgi:peptide/nickel transport system permease protein
MYFLRLLAQYGITLLAALTINFMLPRVAPGDPINFLLSEDTLANMTHEERMRVMSEFGLDLPLPEQFWNYLTGLFRGDFGISVQLGQPVWDVLLDRLPWTLLLSGGALVFSAFLGSVLGIFSAWRRGRSSDAFTLGTVLFIGSIPTFWLAMMLIILFSTTLGWLPSFGAYPIATPSGSWNWYVGVAERLVLPVLALGLIRTATILLVARSSMLIALEQDYILFARAKGLRERAVYFRHALRNALLPLYTNIMLELGMVISGALVIETVFNYPGLGGLVVSGVQARDYNMLQGIFVFTTVSIVVVNLITDLFYPLIDPRTRRTA